MAAREVITEGDARLRQKAIKVRKVDQELRQLAADMFETMHEHRGVGLAAPQIGLLRRFIVIGLAEGMEEDDSPAVELALVNPEIVRASGRQIVTEGCLSIPNWYGEVPRAKHVTVKARDLNDKEVRIKASGYLASILQHEIDHLDGVLFLDRVEDRSTLHHISDEELAALEAEADAEAQAEAGAEAAAVAED
ncbi:MAG TPA: peptide deformylase [Thermomicrobiaceae bacterium]|nr:peptide deformylase [Thermomicrobiaceae bacterium]